MTLALRFPNVTLTPLQKKLWQTFIGGFAASASSALIAASSAGGLTTGKAIVALLLGVVTGGVVRGVGAVLESFKTTVPPAVAAARLARRARGES
jgi:hypothetical protein